MISLQDLETIATGNRDILPDRAPSGLACDVEPLKGSSLSKTPRSKKSLQPAPAFLSNRFLGPRACSASRRPKGLLIGMGDPSFKKASTAS